MGRKVEFDVDKALHRAMKLFWSEGYEATSMQDLVDALEINRFSIYNTFGDKKALFIKVLHHYREVVLGSLLSPLSTDSRPKKRLDEYIQQLGRQVASSSGMFGCMIQNTSLGPVSRDEDVRKVLGLLFADLKDAVCNTIAEAQHAGEINNTESAELLGWFILSQLQGLIILRKSTQSAEFIEGQINLLRRTVAGW